MALFLYGTLRHLPLLEVVLGRTVGAGEATPATVPDASVEWVEGADLAVIRLGAGGTAEGLVMSQMSDEDRSRLEFYMACHGMACPGCKVKAVTTSAGAAQTHVPDPPGDRPGLPWSLTDWVLDHGDLSVAAAQEIMDHMGLRPPAEVARMMPAIRTRAGGRLRALARRPDGFAGAIRIESRSLTYADFFAVEDFVLSAERFEGGMTAPLRRAVFVGMDASIVLPYDPVRDRVLIVEQMRLGPIGRGDPDAWLFEPVAGHVDPGETPEEAARREALEEAGLTLDRLELVAESYPSPGATSDYHYIYVGLTDLPDGADGVSGVESEGENIRSRTLSFARFMEMLERCEFRTGPLVSAGYWLAHHRERLRASGAAST